jgi:hypothetical protein
MPKKIKLYIPTKSSYIIPPPTEDKLQKPTEKPLIPNTTIGAPSPNSKVPSYEIERSKAMEDFFKSKQRTQGYEQARKGQLKPTSPNDFVPQYEKERGKAMEEFFKDKNRLKAYEQARISNEKKEPQTKGENEPILGYGEMRAMTPQEVEEFKKKLWYDFLKEQEQKERNKPITQLAWEKLKEVNPKDAFFTAIGVIASLFAAGATAVEIGSQLQVMSPVQSSFLYKVGDALQKVGSIPYNTVSALANKVVSGIQVIKTTPEAVETLQTYSGMDFDPNDPNELKAAYRKAIINTHPDLHKDDPSITQKAEAVNKAYDFLSKTSLLKKATIAFLKNIGTLGKVPGVTPEGVPDFSSNLLFKMYNLQVPALPDGTTFKEATDTMTNVVNLLIKSGDEQITKLFGDKPITPTQLLNKATELGEKITLPANTFSVKSVNKPQTLPPTTKQSPFAIKEITDTATKFKVGDLVKELDHQNNVIRQGEIDKVYEVNGKTFYRIKGSKDLVAENLLQKAESKPAEKPIETPKVTQKVAKQQTYPPYEKAINPKTYGGATNMDEYGLLASASETIGRKYAMNPKEIYDWAIRHNINSDTLTKIGISLKDENNLNKFTEAVLNDKPFSPPPEIQETQPLQRVAVNVPDQDVLKVIKDIDIAKNYGNSVPTWDVVPELIKRFNISEEQAKQILLDLDDKEIIHLQRYDNPSALPEEQRKYLIPWNDSNFGFVTIRGQLSNEPQPQVSKPNERITDKEVIRQQIEQDLKNKVIKKSMSQTALAEYFKNKGFAVGIAQLVWDEMTTTPEKIKREIAELEKKLQQSHLKEVHGKRQIIRKDINETNWARRIDALKQQLAQLEAKQKESQPAQTPQITEQKVQPAPEEKVQRVAETPKTETPQPEIQKAETPKTETQKVETPTTETQKQEVKTEQPKQEITEKQQELLNKLKGKVNALNMVLDRMSNDLQILYSGDEENAYWVKQKYNLKKNTDKAIEQLENMIKQKEQELEQVKGQVNTLQQTLGNLFKERKGSITIPSGDEVKKAVQETLNNLKQMVYPDVNRSVKTYEQIAEERRIAINKSNYNASKIAEELDKYGKDPKYRKIVDDWLDNPNKYIEQFEKLPQSYQQMGYQIKDIYEKAAEINREAGILDAVVENYTPHIYKNDPDKVFMALTPKGGKLGRTLSYSLKRSIPTKDEARALGLEPIDNPVLKVQMYLEQSGITIANKRFFEQLLNTKSEYGLPLVSPKPKKQGQLTIWYNIYQPIKVPAFTQWAYMGEDKKGKVLLAKTELRAHPSVAPLINDMFAPYRPQNIAIKIYQDARGIVKRALLINPIYHGWNLLTIYLTDTNLSPKALAKLFTPTSDEIEERAINAGLEIGKYSNELREKLKKELSGTGTALDYALSPIIKIEEWSDKILFDRMLPKFQVKLFEILTDKLKQQHPDWSQREIDKMVADIINIKFGTIPQNWLSDLTKKGGPIVALAYQWNIGVFDPLVSAVTGGGRGIGTRTFPEWERKFIGSHMRRFVLKSLLYFYTLANLTQVIGLAVTNELKKRGLMKGEPVPIHFMFQNESGHKLQLDLGFRAPDGSVEYVHFPLFKNVQDWIKLVTQPKKLIWGKLEPILKTGFEIVANYSVSQRKQIVPQGTPLLKAIAKGGKYVFEQLTPSTYYTDNEGRPKTLEEWLFPILGMWVTRGSPGGELQQEIYQILDAKQEQQSEFDKEVSNLLQRGKKQEAIKFMTDHGYSSTQIRDRIMKYEMPFTYTFSRLSKEDRLKFIQYLQKQWNMSEDEVVDKIREKMRQEIEKAQSNNP